MRAIGFSMNKRTDENVSKQRDWDHLVKEAFSPGFWCFALFTCGLGFYTFSQQGSNELLSIAGNAMVLVGRTIPTVILGLCVAGLVRVMLPTERVTALIGTESGYRGLLIGMVAGCLTPGGPSTACALILAMGLSGGDRGALIAFFSGFAMLNIQRLLLWELPFMGEEFVLIRFLICLPLPIVAGLVARQLPFKLIFNSHTSGA
jgi:uncharacterized membrane protein YraQ (UPF0718 family)